MKWFKEGTANFKVDLMKYGGIADSLRIGLLSKEFMKLEQAQGNIMYLVYKNFVSYEMLCVRYIRLVDIGDLIH